MIDFVSPQRIGNVLTAGTPLLRLRIGNITFVREGARGALVRQCNHCIVPHVELDESDRQVIEAQADPPPTEQELNELYLALNGWTKQDFGGWTDELTETDYTLASATELQEARDLSDEAAQS